MSEERSEEGNWRSAGVPLAVFGFLLGLIATFVGGLFSFDVTLTFATLFTAFWVAFHVNGHRLPFRNFVLISVCLWIGYGVFLLAQSLFFLIIS